MFNIKRLKTAMKFCRHFAYLVTLHFHNSLKTNRKVSPIQIPILLITDLLETKQLCCSMHLQHKDKKSANSYFLHYYSFFNF